MYVQTFSVMVETSVLQISGSLKFAQLLCLDYGHVFKIIVIDMSSLLFLMLGLSRLFQINMSEQARVVRCVRVP